MTVPKVGIGPSFDSFCLQSGLLVTAAVQSAESLKDSIPSRGTVSRHLTHCRVSFPEQAFRLTILETPCNLVRFQYYNVELFTPLLHSCLSRTCV